VEITLTPDQEAFVRQAIENGRFDRAEDAITEALLLWEEREARRLEFLASLDEAETSLDRGEGIPITRESMQALAEDVKRRGRQHLARRHGRNQPDHASGWIGGAL
jgi:putative addiction module CopG family antidote